MIDAIDFREGDGGGGWGLYNGDCVEVLGQLPDESVGFSVFSPPFSSLYTYSNSDRDLGNCRTDEEFFAHFAFVLAGLYRVLKPGRLVSMHCMDMPRSKARNGFIGTWDFPGDLIRAAEAQGFIFHSRVCIRKDPVTAMQRTKAIGLLHKQVKKDSCRSRQGYADYVVTLYKPGLNPEPVSGVFEHYFGDDPATQLAAATMEGDARSIAIWQRYADPVWDDIDPGDTLQYRAARDHADERHIAPLQLGVIRRCVDLWSNPGDVVLSPFAGIGSEVFVAAQMGRRGLGVELKPSYFAQALRNLDSVDAHQVGLFAGVDAQDDREAAA
ncbi:DNA methylase [Sphingomonas ginsenosidimutans]|uniref:Methyltransferase n=1 Tax=Sphingomonas ginsenosidimutans TaxID=862134 RepID=A0A2A4HZ82_9SPHN|nr:DNA methyltransferase [Sphingomonas ginsenosidimutans]PCG09680.1 DNA methylase [Sphingomonas ginsenosidimutans]